MVAGDGASVGSHIRATAFSVLSATFILTSLPAHNAFERTNFFNSVGSGWFWLLAGILCVLFGYVAEIKGRINAMRGCLVLSCVWSMFTALLHHDDSEVTAAESLCLTLAGAFAAPVIALGALLVYETPGIQSHLNVRRSVYRTLATAAPAFYLPFFLPPILAHFAQQDEAPFVALVGGLIAFIGVPLSISLKTPYKSISSAQLQAELNGSTEIRGIVAGCGGALLLYTMSHVGTSSVMVTFMSYAFGSGIKSSFHYLGLVSGLGYCGALVIVLSLLKMKHSPKNILLIGLMVSAALLMLLDVMGGRLSPSILVVYLTLIRTAQSISALSFPLVIIEAIPPRIVGVCSCTAAGLGYMGGLFGEVFAKMSVEHSGPHKTSYGFAVISVASALVTHFMVSENVEEDEDCLYSVKSERSSSRSSKEKRKSSSSKRRSRKHSSSKSDRAESSSSYQDSAAMEEGEGDLEPLTRQPPSDQEPPGTARSRLAQYVRSARGDPTPDREGEGDEVSSTGSAPRPTSYTASGATAEAQDYDTGLVDSRIYSDQLTQVQPLSASATARSDPLAGTGRRLSITSQRSGMAPASSYRNSLDRAMRVQPISGGQLQNPGYGRAPPDAIPGAPVPYMPRSANSAPYQGPRPNMYGSVPSAVPPGVSRTVSRGY